MKDETTTDIAIKTMPTRDPFAMLDALERLASSNFVKGLVETGYYSDKGDSKQQTLHKLVTKIAWGAELGMTPMSALKNVIVIKGNPTLSAGAVGDLVMRSGVVQYRVLETTETICRMEWFRNGRSEGMSVWTIQEARTAGLVRNNRDGSPGMWEKYATDLLRARCITRGARTYCPDVFGGPIYTPEELKTEVVEVRQFERPDPDRDKERTAARNNLVEVVKDCTTSRDEQVRVWKACGIKADKRDSDMTTADYREAAGRVKAFFDEGTLTQWCDTMHGPDADAEVVDAEVVEPNADDWKRANGMFHAELTTFLKAGNHQTKGDEYKIIKDMVRDQSGLAFDAEWSEVLPQKMRTVAKTIAHDGGALARVGIVGDWQTLARSRGAIE